MKPYKILCFMILTFMLLGAVGTAFPEDGIKVKKWTLYFSKPNEIFKSEKADEADVENNMEELHQELTIKEELALPTDSFMFYKHFADSNIARLHFPENDYAFLDTLFAQLESAASQSSAIHILHYGDSQIEFDRMSRTFRQRLQELFGGEGVGIVPAIQPFYSISTSQSYSGKLTRYIAFGDPKRDSLAKRALHKRYGIMGNFAQLKGAANFSIKTRTKSYPTAKKFSRVTLLLGNNSADFSAACNNQKRTIEEASSEASVLSWDFEQPLSSVNISFKGSAEIYGISLEGKSGVSVDNIAWRGNSGDIFTELDSSLLKQSFDYVNAKLIILQFGGNFLPSLNSDEGVKTSAALLAPQIRYLQKINPSAKILFIGPSDKSKKVKGKLQTHPYLPKLNEELKQTALENNAAYWDMFHVMGGENSMLKWVNRKPPWGKDDYTHFTDDGAEKVSALLSDAFLLHYKFYALRKRHSPEAVKKFFEPNNNL